MFNQIMFMTVPNYIDNFESVSTEDRTKLVNSKVRGKALINTLTFIEKEFGKSKKELLINKLEIPTQILLRKRIIENEWYQLQILIELNIHIANMFYKGDALSLQKLGEFAGVTLFSTFSSLKLKLSDLKSTAEIIKDLLEQYYLPATVTIRICESKHFYIECAKLFDPSNTMIFRFAGIVKAILQKKGFTSVEVIVSKSDTDKETYFIQAIWA